MKLQNLEIEGFNIQADLAGDTVELKLQGAIQSANPEDFLDPYFKSLIEWAAEDRLSIRCDFVLLEYMNSASIPPLISLLRKCAENSIEGEFIYDSKRKVQAASFKALDVIARKSKFTTVKGV